jgi:hypothetical protein
MIAVVVVVAAMLLLMALTTHPLLDYMYPRLRRRSSCSSPTFGSDNTFTTTTDPHTAATDEGRSAALFQQRIHAMHWKLTANKMRALYYLKRAMHYYYHPKHQHEAAAAVSSRLLRHSATMPCLHTSTREFEPPTHALRHANSDPY